MERAYKFRIYPNVEQERKLNSTLRLCCELYNACIEQRCLAYRLGYSIHYEEQCAELPRLKEVNPEYKLVYAQVLQDALRRVERSFRLFFKGHKKSGVGYPRYKSNSRYKSITYPQHGYKFISNTKIRISTIGNVRIFRHRNIGGNMNNCTIKRDGRGRWYAIFVCTMPDIKRKALKTAIGVDVGIINAVAVSDGTIVKSPKLLGGYSDKISVLGRRMDKKEVGSENWKKAAARLSKQHSKVANKRDDFLHKLSKQLVQKADVVIFEKLNIRNMQKLHSLARSIEDAGWYKLMEYTAYKAEDAGGYVCFVDASGTTQLCSKCGVTVRKSSSERLHSCPTCGFSADRDLNASLNILRRLRTDGVKLCKMPVETEPPRSRRREREHGRRSRTPERDDVTSIFIRREKVQP